MDLVETQFCIFTTQRNTELLYVENGLVEVALCGGEAAGDRPSACYVSSIAAVLLLPLLEIYVDGMKEVRTPPASTRTISPFL